MGTALAVNRITVWMEDALLRLVSPSCLPAGHGDHSSTFLSGNEAAEPSRGQLILDHTHLPAKFFSNPVTPKKWRI